MRQKQDWEELEKLADAVRGKNFRPATLRLIIIGGLFFLGIVLILLASMWSLGNSNRGDFWSGVLANIGSNLLCSIIIFIAIERLARSLQQQSANENALIDKIHQMREEAQTEKPAIISEIKKTR